MAAHTKKTILRAAAAAAGVNSRTAQKVLDAALEQIAKAIMAGKRVRMDNFGSFQLVGIAARKYKLPNGKEGIAPPRQYIKFRVSPAVLAEGNE